MAGEWVIQLVEDFGDDASSAGSALEELRRQVDFLGGRVLQPSFGCGWRVQAFFEAGDVSCEPLAASWLPDGMRYVFVPEGVMERLGFPPPFCDGFFEGLRGRTYPCHLVKGHAGRCDTAPGRAPGDRPRVPCAGFRDSEEEEG